MERGELIGLEAEVLDSRNKSNKGIRGKIIDETRNCIIIKTNDREKKLMKNNVMLRFPESGKTLEGRDITGKPEERIKKKSR